MTDDGAQNGIENLAQWVAGQASGCITPAGHSSDQFFHHLAVERVFVWFRGSDSLFRH